jgi:hypothetical protein
MQAIHVAMRETGRVVLWRNNTGRLKSGQRWVSFGLGAGGADLVGILKPSGRFLAVEVKTPSGRQTPEQVAWQRAVESAGGMYVVARSVAEALAAIA